MSRLLPWIIAAIFALASAAHAVALLRVDGRSGFATLPILVPVSKEHERAMRAERNQPSGADSEDVMPLLAAIGSANLDAATRMALAPKVAALRASQQRMLELRNRKHALNTRLMNVGVAVARELSPEQWAVLVMQRDANRARAEDPVFERVLQKLQ